MHFTCSPVTEWKYLVLPLGCRLFPALLLALLFGPGFILSEVLFGKGSLVFLFQLCEHLLPLFLSVLVLVADSFCVDCRLSEIRKCFPPQLRHLRQAQEGKASSQGGKVQI